MKRGRDVWLERRGRYFSRAATGQVDVCVAPMVMVHVWRKGSVLEALMRMRAVEWVRLMSAWQRVVDGSNDEVEGAHSSLALRKL